MRTKSVAAGAVVLALSVGAGLGRGQTPVASGGTFTLVPKSAPDEQRAILEEIREAYKAPHEVDEDVLQALRRSYRQPSAEREAKILSEMRRLYRTNPAHEQAVLREVRKAFREQTPEQEARVFGEIRRLGRLPLGTVPARAQAEQAERLFRKLDANGDGRLGAAESSDFLQLVRRRWDANRDGAIDPAEYQTYYTTRLAVVASHVASGAIPVRGVPLPEATANVSPTGGATPADERPPVYRAGKLPPGLPDWFAPLDADADGQIGLYEWRKGDRPLKDFSPMDRNGDGFLTADEVMHFAGRQPAKPSE